MPLIWGRWQTKSIRRWSTFVEVTFSLTFKASSLFPSYWFVFSYLYQSQYLYLRTHRGFIHPQNVHHHKHRHQSLGNLRGRVCADCLGNPESPSSKLSLSNWHPTLPFGDPRLFGWNIALQWSHNVNLSFEGVRGEGGWLIVLWAVQCAQERLQVAT